MRRAAGRPCRERPQRAAADRRLIKALLWDADGTLAETERDGHLVAFNRAFEALGVPWQWSEPHYGELLAVAGGRERLLYDMSRREEAPSDARQGGALADNLHRLKNQIYAGIVRRGELPLRAGVAELLAECCVCAPLFPRLHCRWRVGVRSVTRTERRLAAGRRCARHAYQSGSDRYSLMCPASGKH